MGSFSVDLVDIEHNMNLTSYREDAVNANIDNRI